jgi:DNA ligase-1
MLKPHAVVTKISHTSSRNAKIDILTQEALAENTELFEGLRYAFDALITFGVKKIPTFSKITRDYKELPWEDFKIVLEKLRNREATGHDARDLIHDAMMQSNGPQWDEWYRKILLKDMKAKFTESSVNKALKAAGSKFAKKHVIPVFEVQLATDSNKVPQKMKGKKRIESKLDGTRVITIAFPSGLVQQFSRNGIAIENFPAIVSQFEKIATKLTEPVVFDGEIMSGKFQDLMKQLKRKKNVQTNDAVLNLFDVLPLAEFLQGRSKFTQMQRSAVLEAFYEKNKDIMPNVAILDYEIVDLDTTEGRKRFEEINRAAIEAGLEGLMIKDMDAVYECKRGFNWLKLKPVISVDLTIVALEAGEEEKKFENTLGALVCEGYDGDKFIRVNVSNVGEESNRDKFWKNPDLLIGQVVEIHADAITKSESKDHYSLRFPRFERFRGFEIGEKF